MVSDILYNIFARNIYKNCDALFLGTAESRGGTPNLYAIIGIQQYVPGKGINNLIITKSNGIR